MNTRLPEWLPDEAREWFREEMPELTSRCLPFATDTRMRPVWEWFLNGPNFRPSSFLLMLQDCKPRLKKPSNMTPGERARYLQKVKKHTQALVELLADTPFDNHKLTCCSTPVEPDRAEEFVLEEIRSAMSYSASESAPLVIAFETDSQGQLHGHNWDYPDGSLVYLLHGLLEWAEQDDYFNMLTSVAAIRHSGVRGEKTAFLASLHKAMSILAIEMPIAHYATITNVALSLSPEDELDEESARKQITRIVERVGVPKTISRESLPF